MEQRTEAAEQAETGAVVGSQEQAEELAKKAGLSHPELREDGAIVFGSGCLVLQPTEGDKLKLTIEPSKCGELQGQLLLDYLIKTAGRGVIIEIPPVEEEQK